jgi:radical SAM superfamily enzyme YgiQ (UPF0313 family)
VPCIGIAYIGAVLIEHGHEVDFIDDFAERHGAEFVADAAIAGGYDIVGLTVLTPCAQIVRETSRQIKEQNPNCVIVLGNIHASLFAEEILETWPVDYVVHNEGEYTMLNLVNTIQAKGDISKVEGITFWHEGKAVRTKDRALLTSAQIDALPYPAWDRLPIHKYGLLPFATIEKPILTMISSKGCPYLCHFCSLMLMDSKYRYRDPIAVADEFEFLVNRYGVKQVGFVDPIFGLRRKDVLIFCDELMRRGIPDKASWIIETRQDRVDEDLLERLRDAGCRRILYGMESGSDIVLKKINKNFTKKHGASAVEAAKKVGMETVGMFILGNPGEGRREIEETIAFARDSGLDFAKFAMAVPFPGSEWYQEVRRKGFDRTDWDNFITFNPDPKTLIMMTDQLGPEELLALQRKATRKFYLRPWQIYNHFFKIRTINAQGVWEAFKILFT